MEELKAIIYDSESRYSMRLVAKNAKITDKEIQLEKAGPKHWQFMICLFFLPFGLLIFSIWTMIAYLRKGEQIIIPFKNIKKAEINHPRFTLIYRIKLTEKNGEEHYFILKKPWQFTKTKEFTEEICDLINKKIK